MKHFLSYDFWFYVNPVTLSRADKVFVLVAGTLVLLGLVFLIIAWRATTPISKRLLSRFRTCFLTIGIVSALWFFIRFENVRALGTHFVFALIMLVGLVWFGYIFFYLIRRYRSEIRAWEKEQLKLKYLPK